jgi:hypothetical protein
MTKHLVLILLCLSCFGSCKAPIAENTGDIVVIDIDRALNNSGKLSLSDFADSISYIPIYDNNSGAFIGNPSRVVLTQNYLLVYDTSGRLVSYNIKERASKQIGIKGRGPQEYLLMKAIAANESGNIIYALINFNSKFIYKYDFDGNFLGSIALQEDADNIGLTDEGHLVVHFTNYTGNGKSQYTVMDDSGKILTDYPNPFLYQLSADRNAWFHESAGYSYGGDIHMKDKSDTLYVFRGGERHPKYVFQSRYSLDGKEDLTQTEYDEAFVFDYVFETNSKLIFNGKLGGFESGEWRWFYYDKATGETFSVDRGFPNDLTDGFPKEMNLLTSDTTFDDCYVKIITNNKSETPGYPQDENASYFIMLVHLK